MSIKKEYVNREDAEYYNRHGYDVSMYSCGTVFRVYADSLDEGLEIIGWYCKSQDYRGLYSDKTWDELLDECDGDEDIFDEHWSPVNGGEFYLNIFCISAEEFIEKP